MRFNKLIILIILIFFLVTSCGHAEKLDNICQELQQISKIKDCDEMAAKLETPVKKLNYYVNSTVVDLVSGDDLDFADAYKCSRDAINKIHLGACKRNSKVKDVLSILPDGVIDKPSR